MVVLAIIGGLMAMATLTAGGNPAEDETTAFARELSVLLDSYREESVFQNVDLGIAMDRQELVLLSFLSPDSQQAEALDDKKRELLKRNPWQPHAEGSAKKELAAPETVSIELFIEEKSIDFDDLLDEKDGAKPALLFLSSDEYTPFKLELSHETDNNFVVRLSGDGFSPFLMEVERYGE